MDVAAVAADVNGSLTLNGACDACNNASCRNAAMAGGAAAAVIEPKPLPVLSSKAIRPLMPVHLR